jgi:uncharacterized protein YutE (UPF0331/DUF86 family)
VAGLSIDKEMIVEKFELIQEDTSVLETLARMSEEDFASDTIRRAAAERLLHVAIEAVIDVGNHLVAALHLRKPNRYTDIPLILEQGGIISKALRGKLEEMIRFRNLLVHGYARIDPQKLHQFIVTNISDFQLFKQEVKMFLGKSEVDGGKPRSANREI